MILSIMTFVIWPSGAHTRAIASFHAFGNRSIATTWPGFNKEQIFLNNSCLRDKAFIPPTRIGALEAWRTVAGEPQRAINLNLNKI
jgi:hypothetical protein